VLFCGCRLWLCSRCSCSLCGSWKRCCLIGVIFVLQIGAGDFMRGGVMVCDRGAVSVLVVGRIRRLRGAVLWCAVRRRVVRSV